MFKNERTLSDGVLERGTNCSGHTAVHAARVAAPFVDADMDRVSVVNGTFAAGPDHDETLLLCVGGNRVTCREGSH